MYSVATFAQVRSYLPELVDYRMGYGDFYEDDHCGVVPWKMRANKVNEANEAQTITVVLGQLRFINDTIKRSFTNGSSLMTVVFDLEDDEDYHT